MPIKSEAKERDHCLIRRDLQVTSYVLTGESLKEFEVY